MDKVVKGVDIFQQVAVGYIPYTPGLSGWIQLFRQAIGFGIKLVIV